MINDATLKLFNSIIVKNKNVKNDPDKNLLSNGIITHPSIKITSTLNKKIYNTIINKDEVNASFHKSWKVVADSSDEQLFIQQILHYFTTYGFAELGIYSPETIYIPNESLDIPNIENLKFKYINALTKEELYERIKTLCGSGIAFSPETINDLFTIITELYDKNILSAIYNRELKNKLFVHWDIAPTEPVNYLRYVITKLTGETLLIKNKTLVNKIKDADGEILDALLEEIPENLSSIFLRYKPLFLALRSISNKKYIFNRLRKDAIKTHTTLPFDYMNNITNMIKTGTFDINEFKEKIQNVSIFRKVRLYNALSYRKNSTDSIVYTVRNGKGFVDSFEMNYNEDKRYMLNCARHELKQSIAKDISDNVKGKIFYVPKGISYTVPATEKSFIGNFPEGTSVSVPNSDTIVGINWKNSEQFQIDLDLSIIGETGKIGWNTSYRNDARTILFSGDITDACGKHGATESMYIKNGVSESKIIMVNDFRNVSGYETIPCKLFIATEKPENFDRNYTVNPNNIVCSTTIELDKKMSTLGVLTTQNDNNILYFTKVTTGNTNISKNDDRTSMARKYFIKKCESLLKLNDILCRNEHCLVVNEKLSDDEILKLNERGFEFVDLSPENISKDTIINLITVK